MKSSVAVAAGLSVLASLAALPAIAGHLAQPAQSNATDTKDACGVKVAPQKIAPAGNEPGLPDSPAAAPTICKHYHLSAAALPAPEKPGDLDPINFTRQLGVVPSAPPGFHVTEFASGIRNPRLLVVAPNGDVFVASSGDGTIMLLRDVDLGVR